MHQSRRQYLRGLGTLGVAGAAAALAGCTSSGSGDGTPAEGDISVGPNGKPVFDPEEYTVSVGDTVEWYFAGSGHNVSAVPDHSEEVSLPDGADPFASYGVDGNPGQTDPAGTTFSHTFETPGTYTYVCVPHVRVNMVADIVVEE
jgi:plastocyanin